MILSSRLSIRDKWFLSSRPILSFRRRAYRRPALGRSEFWMLQLCSVQSGFWGSPAFLSRSAAWLCHSKQAYHWPSVSIGIASFARSQSLKSGREKLAARLLSFISPEMPGATVPRFRSEKDISLGQPFAALRESLWHTASVIAAQRHARSWVQTGSDRCTAKVTRMTQSR
jgi:hypothetical protein